VAVLDCGGMGSTLQLISYPYTVMEIQIGAEPTDTFQMAIDNIWKQGKISETVYKYVQVCHLLPTYFKVIFCKLHEADGLRCIALLQAYLEVAVHAPS
jgi:hypothetical protein